MDQKANFVEPDLAVSKDNVLFCMHDDTLERTTNVAEVFPDRVSTNYQTRQPGKHWVGNDFTMAELKRLDSGKWFKPEFAGQRLLSFQEMIDLVKARPGFGIYPELKSPELYKSRGVDQVKLFVDLIKKNGLEKPESLKTFPVIIQSFDESAIRRVAVDLPTVPRVFLTSRDEDVTEARIKELATFATGIAPEKFVIARHPETGRARARRRSHRHVVDVPRRRQGDEVPVGQGRDDTLPLRPRHRRALHQQPGSVSAHALIVCSCSRAQIIVRVKVTRRINRRVTSRLRRGFYRRRQLRCSPAPEVMMIRLIRRVRSVPGLLFALSLTVLLPASCAGAARASAGRRGRGRHGARPRQQGCRQRRGRDPQRGDRRDGRDDDGRQRQVHGVRACRRARTRSKYSCRASNRSGARACKSRKAPPRPCRFS